MSDLIRRIKTIALKLRAETSTNDPRYEELQDLCDMCTELNDHFTDDGK